MQTTTGTFRGGALTVSLYAATEVIVRPNPALSGEVRIAAAYEHQAEFDRLKIVERRGAVAISQPGGDVTVSTHVTADGDVTVRGNFTGVVSAGGSVSIGGDLVGGIIRAGILRVGGMRNLINGQAVDGPFTMVNGKIIRDGEANDLPAPPAVPTLALAIEVPPGFPLTFALSGGVRAAVADVGGDLSLELSGGSVLEAESAAGLDAEVSDGSVASVGRAHGEAMEFDISDGRLTVGAVEAESVEAEVASGGALSLGSGSVGKIEGEICGRFSFEGAARKAELEVTGAASLGAVADKLKFEVSSGGTLTVKGGDTRKVKGELSGGARLLHGGTVGDAKIEASNGARAEFAEVTGDLDEDLSGGASVSVRTGGHARRGGRHF